jgi:hypothetical protein
MLHLVFAALIIVIVANVPVIVTAATLTRFLKITLGKNQEKAASLTTTTKATPDRSLR